MSFLSHLPLVLCIGLIHDRNAFFTRRDTQGSQALFNVLPEPFKTLNDIGEALRRFSRLLFVLSSHSLEIIEFVLIKFCA